MDSIGDWIYVLFLIIAGVASMIGSINKKKLQGQPRQTPPQEEMMTEILQEMTQEAAPVRRRRRPAQQPLEVKPEKHQFGNYQTLEAGEAYSSYMTKDAATPSPIEVEEQTVFTLEDLPSETDDWRKAFIYSEILQQKYR